MALKQTVFLVWGEVNQYHAWNTEFEKQAMVLAGAKVSLPLTYFKPL